MINRLAELRREQKNGESGFTLIELLVVVVIIGVLIAIAVPLYLNYQKSSNDKAAQSDVRAAISVLETCNSDNASYPTANFNVGSETATGAGAAGTCTGQTINTSKGTTIKYFVGNSGGAYLIVGKNKDGNTANNYCYTSAAGGSVAKTGDKTAYAATC